MLFKLSNLNSNLALTLGYLNPALNNSAQNIFAEKKSHNTGIHFLPVVVLHMYFLGSLRSFLKVAIMSSS